VNVTYQTRVRYPFVVRLLFFKVNIFANVTEIKSVRNKRLYASVCSSIDQDIYLSAIKDLKL
jgi:hypothetical protein